MGTFLGTFVGTFLGTLSVHGARHEDRIRQARSIDAAGRCRRTVDGRWRRAVLRFATFASASAAVRYFVRDGADCARPEPRPVDPGAAAGRAVDYYNEAGRTVGRWAGRGAAALGLTGPITSRDELVLTRLLSGQLPSGDQVARPVWRPHPDGRLAAGPLLTAIRDTAASRGLRVDQLLDGDGFCASHAGLVRRVDRDPRAAAHPDQLTALAAAVGIALADVYGQGRLAVAHAMAEEKVDVRRAGVDGPVSAPKSVSVLWALADHHTQQSVLAAHRAAVDAAVAYIEREAGHALRGHQGDGQRAERIGTDGLIVAAFDHHTSRADDPQLHTHLVITNLVHGEDDRWSALDSRALFRAQRTAGYLYQAVLRGELTSRLGVTWTPVRKGVAEIDGLPSALLREFSTRRQAIEARLTTSGTAGVKAAQVACLDTRPAKTGRAVAELAAGWWTRAQHHLPDIVAGIRSVLGRTAPLPGITGLRIEPAAAVLFGPNGVTATQTGFDRGDLVRALLEAVAPGTPMTHDELQTVIDRLLASPEVLPLIPGSSSGRRFTTRELARAETDALQLAGAITFIPPSYPAPAAAIAAGLTAEQREALAGITLSDGSVDVVLGAAGTGKTAMLAALHAHYRDLGVPVLGTCVAAVTARRLNAATEIRALSVARLIAALPRWRGLPPRCVLVVDEAGMVGSRDYHRLVEAVVAAGGKLVAVGDPAQLGEIAAGGMFARLARHHTRAELSGNHRQAEAWERDALTDLRAGKVGAALTAYRSHDRIHCHDSHGELRERIAAEYLQALDGGASPFTLIALAATRDDTQALNTVIRQRLQQAGRLGADQLLDGQPLAVGEQVLVTANDYDRDLHNGTRGQITAVSETGWVQLLIDDGRRLTVPAGWAAQRLRSAYALTVHKAQGMTVDVALVDATGIGDRSAGYVALSRARQMTQLHHVAGADPADSFAADAEVASPLAGRPGGSAADETQLALQARLLRRQVQRLAVDQLYQQPPRRDSGSWSDHVRRYDPPDRGYGRSR